MKRRAISVPAVALLLLSTSFLHAPVAAQKNKPSTPSPALLTRTTTRHDSRRLGYAGAVTIVGAPAGSITIEGWQRSEVEVSAELELRAPTAEDLDRLAVVNTFAIDEDANHIRVITTGTHDKKFLTGSDLSVIIQKGAVNFTIPAHSWHGLRADIKLATGSLAIALMPGFSADIDAEVLRTGEVKSAFPGLEPREQNSIGPHSLHGRAGNGGAMLTFTVGDGTIQIQPVSSKQ